MKVGLWNQTVAPPSTTTRPNVTHSITSTFLPRSSWVATCISVATITTSVASSTGASSAPTTPPETMAPKWSVVKRAASSGCASAILNVPKKRMTGRKSNRNFIGAASTLTRRSRLVRRRREVYRGRVDAETLTCGFGAVGEHVTEVGPAGPAAHFDAHHAVRAVGDALDHVGVDRLPVARPAAAGVELGARSEQRSAAADAVVAAVVPVVPVLAGERPLGGRVARHLVLHGVELLAPLRIALLDLVVAHDEQDTSMVCAHSGGNAAYASCSGCSSYGRSRT